MTDYLDAARNQTRDKMKPLKNALIDIALCKHKDRLFDGSNICPACGAVIVDTDCPDVKHRSSNIKGRAYD